MRAPTAKAADRRVQPPRSGDSGGRTRGDAGLLAAPPGRSLRVAVGLVCLGWAALVGVCPGEAGAGGPPLVASGRPLDEFAPRLDRFFHAAGAEHIRLVLRLVLERVTRGIDGTRPGGAFVPAGSEDFQVVGLLPVGRMDQILGNLGELLGQPDRVDGTYRYPGPNGWRVRQHGGWALVGRGAGLPESVPAAVFRSIDELAVRYDVAFRVRCQAVSSRMGSAVRTRVRSGADGLSRALFEPDRTGQIVLGTAFEVVAATLEHLLAGASSATLGANLDDDRGRLRIELSMSAVEGSPMAEWFQRVRRTASPLPELGLAEPSIRVQLALPLPGTLPDRWVDAFGGARAKLLDQTASEPPAGQTAEAAGRVADAALELAQSVARRGRADFRLACTLKPATSLILLAGLADQPAAVENALERIAGGVEGNPEVSHVRRATEHLEHARLIVLKYDWNGGATAARLFGREQTLALASRSDQFFIGYGHQAERRIRELVRAGATAPARQASPLEVSMATAGWIETAGYATWGDRRRPATAGPAPRGIRRPEDRILLQIVPADQGAVTRVVVERVPLGSLIELILSQLAAREGQNAGH